MKFTNALGGCANCGALTSPCWRKGPEDAKHLCNACGSRYLVKGTLEGYKPGLKNRTGGKRAKAHKPKPAFQSALPEIPLDRSTSQKRMRLLKDHIEQQSRMFSDKAVQVNARELQRMQPFAPALNFEASDDGDLEDRSPKSHFERIKQEVYHRGGDVLPEMKDSSDESSPDAELIGTNGGLGSRRRARKPFRPQVSTW